jgi:hypothetical protein
MWTGLASEISVRLKIFFQRTGSLRETSVGPPGKLSWYISEILFNYYIYQFIVRETPLGLEESCD